MKNRQKERKIAEDVNRENLGLAVADGPDELDDAGKKISNPHDKGYKRVLRYRRVLLHMLRKYTDFKWAWDV